MSLSRPGERKDLEAVIKAIRDEGCFDFDILTEHFPNATAPHQDWVFGCIAHYQPKREITEHLLTGWQEELKECLDGPALPRKVVFVVDEKGNCGKTWFTNWCINHAK